jgi:hypothetical protein
VGRESGRKGKVKGKGREGRREEEMEGNEEGGRREEREEEKESLTSIAKINILVSRKGTFSANLSRSMATSKQSPKSKFG